MSVVQLRSTQRFSNIYRIKFRIKIKVLLTLLASIIVYYLFPILHDTPMFLYIYVCTYIYTLCSKDTNSDSPQSLSPTFISFCLYSYYSFSLKCSPPHSSSIQSLFPFMEALQVLLLASSLQIQHTACSVPKYQAALLLLY